MQQAPAEAEFAGRPFVGKCPWLARARVFFLSPICPRPPNNALQVDCSNRAKAVALRPSGRAATAAAATEEVEASAPSARSEQRQESESGAGAGASSGSPPAAPALLPGPGLAAGSAADGGEAEGGDGAGQYAECFYYSFCPDDSHRFIALDSYDVNAIQDQAGGAGGGGEAGEDGDQGGAGAGAGSGGSAAEGGRGGTEVLNEHNPNADKNNSEGMEGLDKRHVPIEPENTNGRVSGGGEHRREQPRRDGGIACKYKQGRGRGGGRGHVPTGIQRTETNR